jgi:hypothetical protein
LQFIPTPFEYNILERTQVSLKFNRNESQKGIIWDKVYKSSKMQKLIYLCIFVTGSDYIAQAGLKLTVLLPQPECWNYMWVPACPAKVDFKIKFREG